MQPTEDDVRQLTRALLDDAPAEARLILAGHAELRSLRIDAPAHSPLPIAIIEAPTSVRVPLTGDGSQVYDLRAAISIKLGLHPLGPTTVTVLPAPNWELVYGERSALLDPTGTALATFTVLNDPEWTMHARRRGTVAIVYGTYVGVRRPATVRPGMYDDATRAAELDTSRREGAATCGLVSFSTL